MSQSPGHSSPPMVVITIIWSFKKESNDLASKGHGIKFVIPFNTNAR